ncbi:MAG: aconitate hydratase [Candidatus Obscuribacter sp.]|nr:aconitate hydratase [Candidatus Obscuribacter sp.]
MQSHKQKSITAFYQSFSQVLAEARKRFQRPLTLTEKILLAHLFDKGQLSTWSELPVRGKTQVALLPDRVAMQDATAQMAMLQYMQAGLKQVAVPTSIHCDHLIRARAGAKLDLIDAFGENNEVYDFLKSAAAAHGISFGAPGKGIIHQVILENLAFPGALMVGTDSHTPNAGGLSMLAIGVGGADAVEVMAGEPWSLTWPLLIGVKLKGTMNGWTAPKDIILKLAGILGAAGGTSAIIEYFGDTESIGATGQATIANMGAELGATTSVFPYTAKAGQYLTATGRPHLAEAAEAHKELLRADAEVEAEPEKYFDRFIEIDLSTLEPHIVGPFTPDLARPLSQFAAEAKEKGYPLNLSYALIGSCTNSSYEDMGRAAHIARQAQAAGLKVACGFLVTPGSTQIYNTIERDGQLSDFEAIGAQVLANACGPCIGQWQRSDVKDGEPNSIINSFNRPFKGRNDNNPATHAFIASPEIVTAFALAGRLDFNPLTDSLVGADGKEFKLSPPQAAALPPNGFIADAEAIVGTSGDAEQTAVMVSPKSARLQLLSPFPAWSGADLVGLPVLLKAKGKCTTDHISPAGVEWLRFRGHLDNISNNMFSRVVNSFTGEVGTGINLTNGEKQPLPQIARSYKEQGLGWVVIGDTNYGEGSSREHAAMSPRYLGGLAVIARSFARIHRSNLWKQGMLALTFVDANDYERFQPGDKLSLLGLQSLAPEVNLQAVITHADGSSETIMVSHGMGDEQIRWFKEGSFLNFVRTKREKATTAEEAPFCSATDHTNCDHGTVKPTVATAEEKPAAEDKPVVKPKTGFMEKLKSFFRKFLESLGWE